MYRAREVEVVHVLAARVAKICERGGAADRVVGVGREEAELACRGGRCSVNVAPGREARGVVPFPTLGVWAEAHIMAACYSSGAEGDESSSHVDAKYSFYETYGVCLLPPVLCEDAPKPSG